MRLGCVVTVEGPEGLGFRVLGFIVVWGLGLRVLGLGCGTSTCSSKPEVLNPELQSKTPKSPKPETPKSENPNPKCEAEGCLFRRRPEAFFCRAYSSKLGSFGFGYGVWGLGFRR